MAMFLWGTEMALHRNSTNNHKIESFTYANAADRQAATGFTSDDLNRIAFQVDEGSYWRLVSALPTWAAFGGAGGAPAYADLILESQPFAYYKLNETSGTTAFDSSGNGRDIAYPSNYQKGGTSLIPGETDSCCFASPDTSASTGGGLDFSPLNLPGSELTIELVFSYDTPGIYLLFSMRNASLARDQALFISQNQAVGNGQKLQVVDGVVWSDVLVGGGNQEPSKDVTFGKHHLAYVYVAGGAFVVFDGYPIKLPSVYPLSGAFSGIQILQPRNLANSGTGIKFGHFAFYDKALPIATLCRRAQRVFSAL